MTDQLWREAPCEFVIREPAPGGTEERIVEGLVVPVGEVATVADRRPDGRLGPAYQETIARSAIEGIDPGAVLLELGQHGGPVIGRGISAEPTSRGLVMAFRISRTAAGNDGLELLRDGVYRRMSVAGPISPGDSRRRKDGVVERTRLNLRRVAVLEQGAYEGAQVSAVRAATEDGTMPEDLTPAAADAATPAAEADAAATERAETATRATAERAAVAAAAPRGPIVVTRDQFVYGPHSERSFLRDLVNSHRGDSEAMAAQERHNRYLDDVAGKMERAGLRDEFGRAIGGSLERAGDVLSSEIPGAYPNVYLPGLLTPRILKGRPMGGFFNIAPISSGQPQIYAKVTTSTTAAVQSAEGANPAASDFATTAVTSTPLLYGAETVVSRQVIDGASPAAEQMILNDMIEAYAQASETVIKTAVEAGASASGTAIAAATPFAGTLGNVIAYYGARFKPAMGQFIPSALFAVLLAEADTTGRPKMPNIGPINSSAVTADGAAGGSILGAQTFLSYASTANVVVTARPDDYVIFESPVARFSYDAVTGPSGVRLGVWAYLVVGARLGGLKVTAA